MPRGLDHVVHVVRDLDAAGAFYERLGFIVGARNRHPWGTHNRIVQLPGFFIEILTVAERDKIVAHGPHTFSFGAFQRDFLARCEGLSMILLEGRDGAGDAAAFRAAGLGAFTPFDFSREARRPDGSAVTLAFSLAFARDPKAPEIGFATCHHRHPDAFWNPAFQAHANTVTAVAGVVMVADNPADHHIFLSALTGQRDLRASSSGISVATPRGDIQVLDPVAFARHFAVPAPDISHGARLAALRLVVRDMVAARSCLQAGGIAAADRMGRVVIGPQAALGAALVLEPAG